MPRALFRKSTQEDIRQNSESHLQALRIAAFLAVGFLTGWNAFSGHWSALGVAPTAAQYFAISGVVLVASWGSIRSRREAYVLMLGWYVGAMVVVPAMWGAFFHSYAVGALVTIALAAALALPYTLAPRSHPRLGCVPGIVLSALPPLGFVGLASPWLLAGAMLPGQRWIGLLAILALFSMQAWESKISKLITMLCLLAGGVAAAVPMATPPSMAWADNTYLGTAPNDISKMFARQDELKSGVMDALHQGAKLIVLPEGSDPVWDAGQAFYWQDVRALAVRKHATVLLGVYAANGHPKQALDGLFDLRSGKLWPARMTQPVAMWRPWAKRYSFSARLGADRLIPTPYGPAAYTICYEDILSWPLMLEELGSRPRLLISSANQWFASRKLARPQTRSIQMQARMWGLPLLRAVNWPLV